MYPRVHRRRADADGGRDLPERLAYAAAVEGRAGAGEEEGARAGPGAQAVAYGGVAAQRVCGGRVQRHQPGAVELRLTDRDDARPEVDVLALERNRLADSHADGGEQPEQRLVGRRPQRRAERSGALQQPADVAVRPQVGGGRRRRAGNTPGGGTSAAGSIVWR